MFAPFTSALWIRQIGNYPRNTKIYLTRDKHWIFNNHVILTPY
jgi:hypothetical protein